MIKDLLKQLTSVSLFYLIAYYVEFENLSFLFNTVMIVFFVCITHITVLFIKIVYSFYKYFGSTENLMAKIEKFVKQEFPNIDKESE